MGDFYTKIVKYKYLLLLKYIVLNVVIPLIFIFITLVIKDGYKVTIVFGPLYILIRCNLDMHIFEEKTYRMQREYLIKKCFDNNGLSQIEYCNNGITYEMLYRSAGMSCKQYTYKSDNSIAGTYNQVPWRMSHIRGWEPLVDWHNGNAALMGPAFKGLLFIISNRNGIPEMVYDSKRGDISYIINGLKDVNDFTDIIPKKAILRSKYPDNIKSDIVMRIVGLGEKIGRPILLKVNKNDIALFISDKGNPLRGSVFINESKMEQNLVENEILISQHLIDTMINEEEAKIDADINDGYMQEFKINRIKELGFEVSEMKKKRERYILKSTTPEVNQLIAMLKVLSIHECISFWDCYYNTVTDPGAYVTAYVLDENRVAYKESNHGWSSDYNVVSMEEFSTLVIKNWDKDCDNGIYFNSIRISPNNSFTWGD